MDQRCDADLREQFLRGHLRDQKPAVSDVSVVFQNLSAQLQASDVVHV